MFNTRLKKAGGAALAVLMIIVLHLFISLLANL